MPRNARTAITKLSDAGTAANVDLTRRIAALEAENARLLGELHDRTHDLAEALEYQTATSEVLQVISRSTFDLDTILETVATSAFRLCRADHAVIFRNAGGDYRWAAGHGISEQYEEHERRSVIRPGTGTVIGRAVLERRAVHIEDAWTDPLYEDKAAIQGDDNTAHTMLGVPLLREGVPIGAIGLARSRIEPFSDRETELVTTFADQAVIAIENARLLGELRERTRDLEESLEYQTATSDVLQVISRSTFDLQPVLETLVRTATELCAADQAVIFRREGELYPLAANYGFPPEYEAEIRSHAPTLLERAAYSVTARAAREGRIIHIEDVAAANSGYPPDSVSITLGKQRTSLGVPLLREGEPIGVLSLARQRVEPFSERQIELVRTFADQAVIAIENTRLLTELRESLEQQQAMAEVLGVINANPGNLEPVFEAMLERAIHLCDAAQGVLWTIDGGRVKVAATSRIAPEFVERLRRIERGEVEPAAMLQQIMRGEPIVHVPDLAALELYREGDATAQAAVAAHVRTLVWVALQKDGAAVGAFAIARREVKPFSDQQIALLQNFAAQAVIAMDNARLLDEIRRRQAELRVTFDNMGDGVAMFDAEMRLAAWNTNFQKILDLPDEFVAGRPTLTEYFDYMSARGEYASADLEEELRQSAQLAAHESRFERTRPDGRVVEVRRNAVPGGGSVLIIGDITERKRAEEAVRAARDTAERALGELRQTQQQLVVQQKMAALGQLTAGIAHEIKNPLNFVNNFAALSNELLAELKDMAAPAFAPLAEGERAEIDETIALLTGNLDKIAEHGRRADNIVKSMLEHSRGASGERRAVDLNGLVEEALNLAYHGARAQDQSFNITLERDFAPEIGAVELVPQDVTRVFLNLMGNGFYAANKRRQSGDDPAFRPVLKVTTRELGDAVEIAVRDNGIGIPSEVRDRLFQPFFTTKPTGEGTGLGLSISYDIVTQQHGGSIAVDSRVGEFTEFTVRLPRAANNQNESGRR